MWFFRNKRGGCAYFDAVGRPWPLHPCMDVWKTDRDVRAVREAITAYERAVVKGLVQSRDPRGGVRTVDERRASTGNLPNWWIVLSGLLAALESLPIAIWALAASDGGSVLLLLWMVVVPVIAMPIALGWFLVRVPRKQFDGSSWLGAVAFSPVLMTTGIICNLFTCGFGLPAIAAFVAFRANSGYNGLRHH